MSSSCPTITFASSLRPWASTWDTIGMRDGLLLRVRDILQALRVKAQLLSQLQGFAFLQLRIIQGAFNGLKQILQAVIFVSQAIADCAGQISNGDIALQSQLACGQQAESRIGDFQRHSGSFGMEVEPTE